MTKPRKLPCAMCGNVPKGGWIECFDIVICNSCRREHPSKTDDELLHPFLRPYLDGEGKPVPSLRRMH